MSKKIAQAAKNMLTYIGEEPSRLPDAGAFFEQMLNSVYSGYRVDTSTLFCNLLKNEGSGGLVMIGGIELFSMCEHHFLPFIGTVDIGYVPGKFLAGIGDFVDAVNAFGRRLQIQESLTDQIGKTVERRLKPKSLIVRIKAKHTCTKVGGHNIDELVTVYRGGSWAENAADLDAFWKCVK